MKLIAAQSWQNINAHLAELYLSLRGSIRKKRVEDRDRCVRIPVFLANKRFFIRIERFMSR